VGFLLDEMLLQTGRIGKACHGENIAVGIACVLSLLDGILHLVTNPGD